MQVSYINDKARRRIDIVPDPDHPSPREDPEGSFGTFVGYPDRKYRFGDENIRDSGIDADDVDEAMNERITETVDAGGRAFPVRCYEHSLIKLSLGNEAGPGDPGGWDTRHVGWFFVTEKDVAEIGKTMKDAETLLIPELEELTYWYNGWAWKAVESTGEPCGVCGNIEWTEVDYISAAWLSLEPEDNNIVEELGIPADPGKAAAAGWRRVSDEF